ncbi:MAG TPA: DUF4360 domain-containing protein [Bacteriovoracaceae bacterium]|nr:DUF4360 domain-containing protein [Bacteriovoracaceae bacterium]
MFSSMKKLASVTLLVGSLSAFAQDTIQLGYPAMGGNGCPQGTASASLSPDGTALSIIFDQFLTEAGPASGRTIDRKSCNIAVPVHVPNGFSISVLAVDYRGYVGLPVNASARLSAEYFFAGAQGPRFVKDFIGRTDNDYTFQNQLGVQAMVWSPCGADVNLRVNASMQVRNTNRSLDAIASVDSADISAGLVYHIQMRRCR